MIDSIPEDTEILFLPDMYLGLWLERVTGRELEIWMGECHVHAGIRPADIDRITTEDPDAELLVHPECGCASQAMAFANDRTQILDREDDRLREALAEATLHHRDRDRDHPPAAEGGAREEVRAGSGRRRMPVHEDDRRSRRCATRSATTSNIVTVEPELAAKARGAIDRMVAIS